MSQTRSLVLLAGAALSLSSVALATEPVNKDEVRAVVAEMLADAETRSSLLQGGGTSGHDGKFFVASSDGNFRLNVGGQVQFRYVVNWSDDDNLATNDDWDGGFQTRRTKLDFTGHIVNPDWTYRVLSSFDRDGGSGILEEAFVQYNWGNGMKARWGQFKLPLLREELVSSSRQLAAERSLTNEIFTQDRSQGIQLAWEEEDWNLKLAFSDGLDTENTDLLSSMEADYAFTGRFEYKFAGDWNQFDDFTSPQGSDWATLLGLAGHFQQSANTNNPSDTDTQTFVYTADLSLEGDGWNAFLAGIGSHVEANTLGMDEVDSDNFGAVAQVGYRFAPDTELFGRWDGIFADEDLELPEDNFNFITVGVNQYYAGHAAKATIDAIFALNETADEMTGEPFLGILPNTATGLRGDTDTGEVVLRFQFQLLF